MVDCGNGSVANLASVMDPLGLDGVFVTHAHPDHCVDLFCLQALLRYAPGGPSEPLDLWGPADLLERLGCILSDNGAKELSAAFAVQGLQPGQSVVVGGLEVRVSLADHSGVAFMLDFRHGDSRLFYTGDTAMGSQIIKAAEGASTILAEATLLERYRGLVPHLTAGEAAVLAREAGADRLILTHLWPTFERDAILDEARAAFEGEIILASEGLRIEI